MNRVLMVGLCAAALTGCEREKPSTATQTYSVLADHICACKDTRCVEDVMARWHERSTATKEWPTFREDEAKAKAALEDRMNGCVQTMTSRSGSRPHSSMQIALPSAN